MRIIGEMDWFSHFWLVWSVGRTVRWMDGWMDGVDV